MSVSGFNLGMWALDIGVVSDGFAVKQSVLGRQNSKADYDPRPKTRPALYCEGSCRHGSAKRHHQTAAGGSVLAALVLAGTSRNQLSIQLGKQHAQGTLVKEFVLEAEDAALRKVEPQPKPLEPYVQFHKPSARCKCAPAM